MNIKFFKSKIDKDPFVRVNSVNRLAFSKKAIELMKLEKFKFCKIGTNEKDEISLMLTNKEDKYSRRILNYVEYSGVSVSDLVKNKETNIFRYKDKFRPIKTEILNTWILIRTEGM